MASFILIHGAWHGGWCWRAVADLLRGRGHDVLTPDLAGMGDDSANRSGDLAGQSVARLVDLVGRSVEPPVVVGHSMGGMFTAQLSERCADAIRGAVYLAAFLPHDGQTCSSFGPRDSGSVPYGMVIDLEAGVAHFRDDWLKLSFFGDCTDEEVEWARGRIRSQPLQHFEFEVSLSPERFGRVPRAYIQCMRDHAITPGFQAEMARLSPCERVISLDASHSPFISQPEAVADALCDLFRPESASCRPWEKVFL